mgnify:CR=1 FL=1
MPTFAQIEAVVIKRKEELMEQIPGLKTLKDRTIFCGTRWKNFLMGAVHVCWAAG